METQLGHLDSTQFKAGSERPFVQRLFTNQGRLRSGWGCALFVLLTLGLTFVLEFFAAPFLQKLDYDPETGRSPAHLLLDRTIQFAAALISTWLMARIERRSIREYGFSWQRFGTRYWQGAAIGVGSLSLLLFVIYALGDWRIDGLHLRGWQAGEYALIWGLAFGVTALSEETQMRGYLLAALSRGIGFWPAAILLSLLFASLHLGNGGENYMGIAFAAAAGLAFSYMILRTGSLALVFGFHAAWDWGESFLYGTPDSGQHVYGYLLVSHVSGNPWVSGGLAGPEGSCLGLLILALTVAVVRFSYRGGRLNACPT
jgi:membrane protease YdiL (CAAX protease family)